MSVSATMKHVCFSGQLGCSGINPCRLCNDVKVQNVIGRCVVDAHLTAEQARIFYAAYDHYLKQLHLQMLSDPQIAANALDLSRVRIEPAPPGQQHASPQDYGYGAGTYGALAGQGSPYGASPSPYGGGSPTYAPPIPTTAYAPPPAYASQPDVPQGWPQGWPQTQPAQQPAQPVQMSPYPGWPQEGWPQQQPSPPPAARDPLSSPQAAARVVQPPAAAPAIPAPAADPSAAASPFPPGLDFAALGLPPAVTAMLSNPEALKGLLANIDPSQLAALASMVGQGGTFGTGPSDDALTIEVEGDDDESVDGESDYDEPAPPPPRRSPERRAAPSPQRASTAARSQATHVATSRAAVVVASPQGDMTVDEIAGAGQVAAAVPEAAPLNGTPTLPKT